MLKIHFCRLYHHEMRWVIWARKKINFNWKILICKGIHTKLISKIVKVNEKVKEAEEERVKEEERLKYK